MAASQLHLARNGHATCRPRATAKSVPRVPQPWRPFQPASHSTGGVTRQRQQFIPRCSAQSGVDAAGLQGNPFNEEEDFDLLSNKIAEINEDLVDELQGCSIYLIGMMGSGKSTLGKMLANTLKYAFFDTDQVIELAHSKQPVSEIFKEHGEEYFRKCETQILKELAPYKKLVVSTGGGAVTNPMNWSYMHSGIVAWLQGDVELLARRVVSQGPESRPLLWSDDLTEENAFEKVLEKLTAILEDRRKYYENADLVISLAGSGQDEEKGAPTAVVMYRLMKAAHERIQDTKKEREAKRQFTITRPEDVQSMRTLPSHKALEDN